jgi:hypothetical protein
MNEPNAVMDQQYENLSAQRPQEPTMRTAPPALPAAGRRDFFDDPRRKSPILALLLSAMPGLGQIYVGYYQQGFLNAIIIASLIALLSSNGVHGLEPLFAIFMAFYWLYNIVDAWRRATFYNNALAGIGPATLPQDDFGVITGRGTLAGGIVLIAVGAIALSNTLFHLPLYWLNDWWPVGLIAAGAWLAYPTFAAKGKQDAA